MASTGFKNKLNAQINAALAGGPQRVTRQGQPAVGVTSVHWTLPSVVSNGAKLPSTLVYALGQVCYTTGCAR